MILPHGAIVAVTDGTKMHLFRNNGHDPEIELAELPHPSLKEGHAGSGGRHRSSTANPDSHRLAEDDFAAAASAYLNEEVLAGRIAKLAIIATPRTLGEMRRHFHKELVERLAGELSKDLVDHPKADIEAALRAG